MRGFTLVEVLISLTVSIVAGALLLMILVNNTGLFTQQNTVVTTGLGLNDSLREIDEQVRQVMAVVVGYPEDVPTIFTGINVLVAKMQSYDQAGMISGSYDYLIVAADISQPKLLRLKLITDPQSTRDNFDKILTTNLEQISFRYLDQAGNPVSPQLARSVETNLTVNTSLGQLGTSKTSSILTILSNWGD